MNVFLSTLRRIALGGIVVLILSLVLKGELASGYFSLFLICSPLLYLLFVFFTWLKARHSTRSISKEMGIDIPSNNYIVTLLRGLFIDITSPIGTIIQLFGKMSTRVISFVITYVIVAAYVCVWFLVL